MHLRGYVAVMRQEITAAMANWPDGDSSQFHGTFRPGDPAAHLGLYAPGN